MYRFCASRSGQRPIIDSPGPPGILYLPPRSSTSTGTLWSRPAPDGSDPGRRRLRLQIPRTTLCAASVLHALPDCQEFPAYLRPRSSTSTGTHLTTVDSGRSAPGQRMFRVGLPAEIATGLAFAVVRYIPPQFTLQCLMSAPLLSVTDVISQKPKSTMQNSMCLGTQHTRRLHLFPVTRCSFMSQSVVFPTSVGLILAETMLTSRYSFRTCLFSID